MVSIDCGRIQEETEKRDAVDSYSLGSTRKERKKRKKGGKKAGAKKLGEI